MLVRFKKLSDHVVEMGLSLETCTKQRDELLVQLEVVKTQVSEVVKFKGNITVCKVVGNRRVMLPISLKIKYLYVLVARICYCNHGWYIYNGFRDKTE